MKKRILAILFALVLFASAFSLFSCRTNDAGGENNGESKNGSESELVNDSESEKKEESETEDNRLVFEVGEELDYNARDFVVLGYNWGHSEFGDTQSNNKGSVVDKALITRDSYVESYLNVKFKIKQESGQWGDATKYAENAYNSIYSGTHAYDLICAYSMVPSILTYKGVLYDLGSDTLAGGGTNYVDYTKAWWPEFLINNLKVNDKIYSISGDASTELLFNLMVVMFDEAALEVNHIDAQTLYEAVNNGEWTLDYMLDLVKGLSKDNGDGIWDINDFYAISSYDTIAFSGFYFGTGNRLVENKDVRMVVSETIISNKATAVFETIWGAVNTSHAIRYCDGENRYLIESGNALFELGIMSQLGNILNTREDIGMLPFPTYGENEEYLTLVANTHSHFCIPIDAVDASASSAVLETLGYASYETVTPIVYENVMKMRYSKDPESSRMFDIIRAGAVTDAGILNYFNFTANSCPDPLSMFRNAVHGESNSWVSIYEGRYKNGMETTLNKLNEFYLIG